jgi:hypothetical protein
MSAEEKKNRVHPAEVYCGLKKILATDETRLK